MDMLTDLMKSFDTANDNKVVDPPTAEDYMKSSAFQQFALQMMWIAEESKYDEKDYVVNKLKRYDIPLTKDTIRIITNSGNIFEFLSIKEAAKYFGTGEINLKYIMKYKNCKKPKYDDYSKYKIEKIHYILKGDDYIESTK